MKQIVDAVTGVNHFPNHQYAFPDLRDEIFKSIADKKVTAGLYADDSGIVVGIPDFLNTAEELGISVINTVDDASSIEAGQLIATFQGSPKQIAKAEEKLIGMLAKPSGIATRTKQFVDAAEGKVRIVSGAWKKMPMVLKHVIRHSIRSAGADFRISRVNFVYLDKNFIRMLGGIKQTLRATAHIEDHEKVIQIKGHYQDISQEAIEAATHGAAIIFIDTGRPEDITKVSDALRELKLRDNIVIAYSGNIKISDIPHLRELDVDRLDIGRAIVDAPLLDMKLDVISIENVTQIKGSNKGDQDG